MSNGCPFPGNRSLLSVWICLLWAFQTHGVTGQADLAFSIQHNASIFLRSYFICLSVCAYVQSCHACGGQRTACWVVLSSCLVGPRIEVGHQAFSGAFYPLCHCAGSIVFSTLFLYVAENFTECNMYLCVSLQFYPLLMPIFPSSFFLPVAVFSRGQVGGALLPRLPVKKRRTA